jgi:hypothetical protein
MTTLTPMLALALLGLAVSATPSRAADITVEQIGDHSIIQLFDEINPGDEVVFAKKTKPITNPAGTVVWLGSPGGQVVAALAIAKMVRDRGYSTLVTRSSGRCGSACPLIWFSGRHAIVQRNSRLVFHMVYDVSSGQVDPEGIAEVTSYLQTVGLTRARAHFLANAAAPSEGWVATEAAARALGFQYQVIDSFQVVDAGLQICQAKFCLAIP